jgi:glycerophosphoryl diester phosphodiesterase
VKNYVLKVTIFAVLIIISSSSYAQDKKGFNIKTVKQLHDYFSYAPRNNPLIFAHRGGAATGLPENCIATFEYTVKTVTPFFEIDPRLTKDSVIVILHDATLDRTTNGTGKLSNYTWAQVKELRLKDANGNLTEHRIPTLEETIKWAKGKCIVMLDHKDVPLAMLANKIKEWNATPQVILSAFEFDLAQYYYSQNKDLMLEVYFKDKVQVDEFEKLGIPWKNIIAYVSQPKKKSFYDLLHSKGIMAMVYTATVVEKEKDETIRKKTYADIINTGGDIILADNVKEVSSVISGMQTPKN